MNSCVIPILPQDRLLRCGTTTATYFGSLHLEGTKILGDTVHARGQRALVGKVNMIANCPSYYQEASLEDSLRETEEFILYIKNLKVRFFFFFKCGTRIIPLALRHFLLLFIRRSDMGLH